MERRSYNTMGSNLEVGRSMDLLTKRERDSCWQRRSTAEKILIVVCCILALISISLIITVAVLSKKKSEEHTTTMTPTTAPPITASPSPVEECTSTVCANAAKRLKASINVSVDPCEDFYSYVCSGWIQSNPIPENKASISSFSMLDDQIKKKLREVLPNTTFPDVDIRTKTKVFYNSCIDNKTREDKGVQSLKKILTDLGNWPLLGGDASNYNWFDAILYLTKQLTKRCIISTIVSPDDKNTSNNIIQLDQTKLLFGRNQLLNMNSSDERIVELLNAYKGFIKKSAKILGSTLNDTDIDSQIQDMLEFEKTLAEYTRSEEERRDPESMYHKMTLGELQSTLSDKLNITSFLQRVFEDIANLSDDTEIIVNEPDYLNKIAALLSGGTIRMETIANYIGWWVVYNYGPQTTQKFRDAVLEYNKVAAGVKTSTPLDEMCISLTGSFFGFSLGNIYINNDFDVETKSEVENIVGNLKTAFSELLTENTWMNDEAKKEAEDKLEAMIDMIAFPPWINDTKELNDFYKELGDIKEDTYFENVLALVKFHIQRELSEINKPHNRSASWSEAPAMVNAFYSPIANTITFPAGILDYPFYQYGLPTAVNYAGIGSVIGHEITHGFDDEGSMYDGEGNLKNWWPKEVKQKFLERAKCFIEQYGNYTDPETGMNLNGVNTQGENIADNGGIREAFKAYKLAVQKAGKNMNLPGLNLTPDQLFFVSFGYMWCGSQTKESLEYLIEYNPHSPAPFRVQGSCSNFEEFTNAFSCSANSTMNPQNKCKLW